MDSIFKLINDKRKELQQFKKGTSISQRELLNKEKEEILQRQREQKEAKEKLSYQKLEQLEKRFERGNKRKLDTPSETKHTAIEITKETTAEIYRKLRKLKLPIIIFAETPNERYNRLCRSEIGLAGSNSSGSNINHDTLANVDREFELHIQALGDSLNDHTAKHKKLYEQNNAQKISDPNAIKTRKICDWISKILDFWEREISQQKSKIGVDVKSTTLLAQTRTGLEPLVKLLRKNKLDISILDKLCKIIDCIETMDYRGAHDTYMMLAIGNAPWPMGVANITIQARPWRSKIYESEVAHILNDDTTRKFIQMFKRLMTIAQRINPTSISKQVHMTTPLN